MRPLRGELVSIIDNESMEEVGRGRVIEYTPNNIMVEDINSKRRSMFDAKTNHFRGYEPPVMKIRVNGKLIDK